MRPGTSYRYRIMACGFGSHSDYVGPTSALDTGDEVELVIDASSTGPYSEGDTFSIELSAIGIEPRKWLIDWGDGITQVLAGTATYAEHVYAQDGLYNVRASITEGDLTFWSNEEPAYILNVAPTATITSSGTILPGSAYTLYFDGVADLSADALTWNINWGDGSWSNGIDARVAWSASHVYAAQGRYRIEATLSDGTTADDVVLVHYAGALPAPANVAAEATGEESIRVTWEYGPGAVDGFLIEVSEDGSQYDLVDSVSGATREYLIEDLDSDTFYYVRVTACQDQNRAGAVVTATTWAGTLPAPADLQGSYGGEYLTLEWDEGAPSLSYQVQIRCPAYGHPLAGQEWLAAAGVGFGDEFGHWVWHGYPQHPAAENELRVRAVSGNSFSPWVTAAVEVGGPGEMPGEAAGFGVIGIGTTSVTLSWSDAPNEGAYDLSYVTASDTRTPYSIRWWDTSPEDENNRRLEAEVTQYTFSGLTPGTTYHFVLQPIGSADAYRTETAVVTVRTLESSLAAASGLEARGAPDFGGIQLRWVDNSYSEAQFVIQRRTLPSGGFDEIDTVDANVTEYLDESAEAGVWYEYRVIAERGSTQSSPSAAAGASLALPLISVTADVGTCSEFSGDPGQILITRDGGSLAKYLAQDVKIATSGAAVEGTDYADLPDTVTIPAGHSGVYLMMEPVDDDQIEDTEGATVTATHVVTRGQQLALAAPKPAATPQVRDNDFNAVVEAITFAGNKPNAIQPVLFDRVFPVAPLIRAYPVPHWRDLNHDHDTKDSNEQRSPVSYFASNPTIGEVKIVAAFKLFLRGPANLDYRVRAWESSVNLDFGPVPAAAQGGYLVGNITANQALPDTIQRWPNMVINWEVSADNGMTWHAAGTTDNRLYASISPGAEYETVLDVGTRNAHGQKLPKTILESIFTDFNANVRTGVKRADGVPMKFWGPITVAADRAVSKTPDWYWQGIGLIHNADGPCMAWADFLADVFEAQGLAARTLAPEAIFVAGRVPNATRAGLRMYIEHWGQGNWSPPLDFNGHMTVAVDNVQSYVGWVFDPSYGAWFSSQQGWEDWSVNRYVYYDGNGNVLKTFADVKGPPAECKWPSGTSLGLAR